MIKHRWGGSAEELKYAEAPPIIKFALGENVKQSNWGEKYRTRYPQTRMGVEAIIRDIFQTAAEYEAEWKKAMIEPAAAVFAYSSKIIGASSLAGSLPSTFLEINSFI